MPSRCLLTHLVRVRSEKHRAIAHAQGPLLLLLAVHLGDTIRLDLVLQLQHSLLLRQATSALQILFFLSMLLEIRLGFIGIGYGNSRCLIERLTIRAGNETQFCFGR